MSCVSNPCHLALCTTRDDLLGTLALHHAWISLVASFLVFLFLLLPFFPFLPSGDAQTSVFPEILCIDSGSDILI